MKKELKRLSVSLKGVGEKKKRVPNFKSCLYCKQDAGKNFFIVYKVNHEIKGKVCRACYDHFHEIKKINI